MRTKASSRLVAFVACLGLAGGAAVAVADATEATPTSQNCLRIAAIAAGVKETDMDTETAENGTGARPGETAQVTVRMSHGAWPATDLRPCLGADRLFLQLPNRLRAHAVAFIQAVS